MSSHVILTDSGPVSGTCRDGIRRHLGIPYAEAPVGARRFALPVPIAPWVEARDATAYGPTSPQSPYRGMAGKYLESIVIAGDENLTVNVWSPDKGDRAAVMLWFHGGAFERGASALSTYDGSAFARDGVVFVSANYRLGIEGFSVLPDAPRNIGVADAAEALRWTHRNAANFGGDPSRITIFGESAGGAMVAALLARDDLRPLIAGAIIQSGPLDPARLRLAAQPTRDVARALGCRPTAAALRSYTPELLVACRDRLTEKATLLRGAPGFNTTVDPVTLPISPRHALRVANVPVLIGTTTDEYRLFYTPPELAALNTRTYAALALAKRIPRGTWGAYSRVLPGASAGEIIGHVLTDLILRMPAIEIATARTAPTFVYELAWKSPISELGAAHALDVGFVFDALNDPAAQRMLGENAPQRLADHMHGDWIRFAKTGDPGWDGLAMSGRIRRYDTVTEDVPIPRAHALSTLARRAFAVPTPVA